MKLACRGPRIGILLLALGVPGSAFAAGDLAPPPSGQNAENTKYIERGRYLVKIAGCNDCHTPHYPQAGGKVPERQWLIGDQLGWRGPWGTTYPANLRKYLHSISEEEWLKVAHTRQMRPPMPWFALRDMSKDDLRAIYRFVRHLGPDSNSVPNYVWPGQVPAGPFVQFPPPQ